MRCCSGVPCEHVAEKRHCFSVALAVAAASSAICSSDGCKRRSVGCVGWGNNNCVDAERWVVGKFPLDPEEDWRRWQGGWELGRLQQRRRQRGRIQRPSLRRRVAGTDD